jgi:hypothetical protein
MFMGLALFGMLMNIIGKAMMAALFGEDHSEEETKASASATAHLPTAWNPDGVTVPPADMNTLLQKVTRPRSSTPAVFPPLPAKSGIAERVPLVYW